jgi:hypothetical protein
MAKVSESAIQRSILDYLAARHIFAIRINSGTQIGSYKGKKWAIHMAAPGTADILAFPSYFFPCIGASCVKQQIHVVPYWLEVKAEKGAQSELQESFQEQVELLGHRYAVVRSIDEVEKALL